MMRSSLQGVLGLTLTFIAAGLIALAVRMLAERGQGAVAGLALMFPVNTLIGWSLISWKSGGVGLARSIPASLVGLSLLAGMLVLAWLLVRSRVDPVAVIAIAGGVWVTCAIALVAFGVIK